MWTLGSFGSENGAGKIDIFTENVMISNEMLRCFGFSMVLPTLSGKPILKALAKPAGIFKMTLRTCLVWSQLKACFLPGTLVMKFVRLSHVFSSFLLTKDFVMVLVKANKRGVAMFWGMSLEGSKLSCDWWSQFVGSKKIQKCWKD